MKKVRAKLRAHRGVTLSEMLVAVLILGLVTAGVAAGTSASLRACRESAALADAQTLSSTLAIALMDELRYARDIDSFGDTTFTSATFGPKVRVKTHNGHVVVGGSGQNNELIGEGAYAGLEVGDAKAIYEDGRFNVTIQVDKLDGSGKYDLEFTVRPLNG